MRFRWDEALSPKKIGNLLARIRIVPSVMIMEGCDISPTMVVGLVCTNLG